MRTVAVGGAVSRRPAPVRQVQVAPMSLERFADVLDEAAPAGGFHLPYVQIWELEAGKAKCVHTLTDTLAIARALGEPAVAPAAPAT